MTTHCGINETMYLEEVKQQNEQYWKIIEKQRTIIHTLQKSLSTLTSENEYLIKRNRELEDAAPVIPVVDSAGVTLHPTTIETASNTTPVPPPRSPYRVNQGTTHNAHDTNGGVKSGQNNTVHALVDIPKRPPFLKLAKSNHSPLYSRAVKDVNTNEFSNKDYQITPGKIASNPSSPLSLTSTGSSSVGNRPSFESIDSPGKQMTPTKASTSPKISPITNDRSHHRNNISHDKNVHGVTSNNLSEPSTPIKPRTPRFDSLMTRNGYTEAPPATLSNLSNIRVRVVSSSVATDEKGKEYSVFVIGILDDLDHEIWRVQKSLADIFHLDTKLKTGNTSSLKKLPDRSPFSTYTPVKMEERKFIVEEYLQHAITLRSIDVASLCAFLSSDQIQNDQKDTGTKQGYLTKRGKNFGGWKTRYFILEKNGALNYFESKDGNYLGRIKLLNAQIRPQTAQEDYESSYRNAFMILESKSNGSFQRHIFCANSEEDRNSWVESLRYYSNQVHSAIDVSNSSSLSEDNMFMDQLVVEPSSSTESARTAPASGKRPSVDFIYTYFTQGESASNHRKSMSKDSASLKDDMNYGELFLDEATKKSKHRSSKKTFWGKKMFGNNNNSNSDMASPTTLQGAGASYDSKYFQAISDYEDTKGDLQVFGVPLESAVLVARVCDQYELPAIVHRCIEYMETRNGLNEEGIYRLSGSASAIKKLKKRFNDNGDIKILEDEEYHDVHAIAGLLKMWLRELPENIFTDALLSKFLQTVELQDRQARISEVGKLVSSLPLINYTLLRSLCAHLIRVIGNSEQNKMSLRNISIVFSATLGIPSNIFNLLLVDFDYIFWTERCAKDYNVPATENTIKNYMEYMSPSEEDVADITRSYQHPSISSLKFDEGTFRSKRNSAHYESSTPKDFISLENQLNAVINDIPTPYDDEPYCSDEELEMAYFASRYTANSKAQVIH